MNDVNYTNYVDRVQAKLYDKYNIKFNKKTISLILRIFTKEILFAIHLNKEVYFKGMFSIYLTKELMIERRKSRELPLEKPQNQQQLP